jgi:hypothetical protein
VIEVYLESHEDQKRSKEELEDLESKNKITHEVYQVGKTACPNPKEPE